MSDKTVPPLPAGISQEQWEKISGGNCTAGDISDFTHSLQEQYNALVDFTSYVIERVAG